MGLIPRKSYSSQPSNPSAFNAARTAARSSVAGADAVAPALVIVSSIALKYSPDGDFGPRSGREPGRLPSTFQLEPAVPRTL